ncbi:hypothetical protein ES705_30324 [subsurface metagenome]
MKLIKSTAGEILFKQSDITKMSSKEFRKLRPQIQIIFQEPATSLNPRKKIRYLVSRPLQIWGKLSASEIEARVIEAMELVNLSREYLDRYPIDLTPGQQQKVAIVRAIINRPALLILDEPTSSLDCVSKIEVLTLLVNLQKMYNLSYLYISHDLATVKYISTKIAVMYLGKIVEMAPTDTIIKNPLHPYTNALWASSLLVSDKTPKDKDCLKGEIPSPIDLPKGCFLYSRCPYAQADCINAPQKLLELEKDHFVACSKIPEIRRRLNHIAK